MNFDKHHLAHTQQREGFLIAQYSTVLGTLQKQYLDIRSKLLTEIEGSFEEAALEGVLDHLREAMEHNEYCLKEAIVKLWGKFYLEECMVTVGGAKL